MSESGTAAQRSDAAVEFRSVTKAFDAGKQRTLALDGIDLTIARGEIFGIIGYSGAGKSTLVRLINGLEKPTSGTVLVGGEPITGVPESRVRQLRRDIGMVFQQFNLFRSRTAAGNIEYPLKVAGWPRAKRKARVAELLEFVGLADKARSYPDQLSGGQKQRVGIARALATSPSLLLADEATSALDPETTQEVLRLLRKINAELGVTIVVITHEMDVIRAVADRVAVLAEGKVVELATTFEVFATPRAIPTRSFVDTVLHNRPGADELRRLSTRHPGRLITVDIADNHGIGPALTTAAHTGVHFELVYGGVSALQDKTFGSITLALDGPADAVARVIEELSGSGRTVGTTIAGPAGADEVAAGQVGSEGTAGRVAESGVGAPPGVDASARA
ncbi:methionine ABC transporter ATP-binding protein [Nocardia terpenica]|nr:methionine ABC transporter ATP-binding protein [Nocardia terpenica]MBF6102871.1 methionine ABC transporter ATP-binding protein [Nocardia terpenica]MBF6110940.1 methionine ABC transporter ATP-binding protein [Nocardia terpenica]MBF6117071.1 methionine ABC transporter ATP-binding protein [Nocardia terpenica]MBF6151091.1 methionine ABC transporter ATP-binding protein [Nocardia terpenica]